MSGSSNDPTVELSEEIYARVLNRVERSEFEAPSEYVEFVLDSLLEELESDPDHSTDDDDEVRDRLRELGYLE